MSRLAILTLSDMYTILGKSMDPELDVTVLALHNKVAAEQGSSFIREEVEMALDMMLANTTTLKALQVCFFRCCRM